MGLSQSQPIYALPISTNSQDPQGESRVYRNVQSIDNLRDGIQRLPSIKTLQDMHKHALEAHANSPCTGTRKVHPDGTLGDYEFKTYREIDEFATKAGSAILNLGLAPLVEAEGNPTCRFISIYAKNREEYIVMDIASCLYGITTLAIYDTLGPDSIEFIFSQTGVQTTFCSGENLTKLLKGVQEGKFVSLKNVISFDEISEESKKLAQELTLERIPPLSGLNLNLIDWENFLKQGENTQPLPPLTGDSIFTFSYTSGTTALPKAVMLTHHNFVAYIGSTEDLEGFRVKDIGPGDTHISYLPMAHILERTFIHIFFFRGARIGFSEALRMKDDMAILKPTFLVSVPRVYNKFYDGIKAKLNELTGWKKNLADYGVAKKLQNLKEKGSSSHTILDKLLFNRMKAVTGGSVKFYMSGAAPISSEVIDFLKIAFSTPFIEGYGQTETCAAAFAQISIDPSSGNVGGPMTSVEFKLVDVPEMKYTSKDKGPNGESMPRGEICLRGHSIFIGYYKDAEKTKETIDQDGWHHTGDIGIILPNGALKILDRKKNIFKLSQGEYVAPEKVEQIYLTNKFAAEIYIYGDSFQTFCVAIVVPEKNEVLKLAEELGLSGKSFEELCNEPKIKAEILKDLNKTGKENKLFGFEMPKAIHLEPVSFVALDLTTPSLKVKRAPAKDYYIDIIKNMYQETHT